jgi:hypothetical protein
MTAFMLLHPLFKQMNAKEEDRILTTRRQVRDIGRVELLIVWFSSVRALVDIVSMRLLYGTKVVFVFHEPFESIRSYRNGGFGVTKTLRVCLIGLINYAMVLLSTKIMLPSKRAVALFQSRYAHTGKSYALIPLLFDDEAGANSLDKERRYISYIGTIAEDHAFDEFVRFVEYAVGKGSFPKHQYLIATRNSLSATVRASVSPLIDSGRLVLLEGKPLSNEAINECYSSSLVVWNAYKRSSQSGVLPKAYMFGTPLLVGTLNQSEFFIDRKNGVLVSERYDMGELTDAVRDIILRFAEYSQNCRRQFVEVFYYKSQSKAFMDLVSS